MLGTSYVDKAARLNTDTGAANHYFDGQLIPNWRTDYKHLEPSNKVERKVVKLYQKAAKSGNVAVLRSLVMESHINPNMHDKKGWTALLRSSKAGVQESVEFLVAVKAQVNCRTKGGNSAVMKAAKFDRADILQILCDANANVNYQNSGGTSALMLAVTYAKDERILPLLVYRKADLDAKKDVGYTALMLAARQGNLFAADQLVKLSASLDAKDRRQESALAKSEKYRHHEIHQLLVDAGATPVDPATRRYSNRLKDASLGPPGSRSPSPDHNTRRPLGSASQSEKVLSSKRPSSGGSSLDNSPSPSPLASQASAASPGGYPMSPSSARRGHLPSRGRSRAKVHSGKVAGRSNSRGRRQ